MIGALAGTSRYEGSVLLDTCVLTVGIDANTARLRGELTARAGKAGEIISAVDGLLAATAIQHGLHIMTRNPRHFKASGALVLDPWQ